MSTKRPLGHAESTIERPCKRLKTADPMPRQPYVVLEHQADMCPVLRVCWEVNDETPPDARVVMRLHMEQSPAVAIREVGERKGFNALGDSLLDRGLKMLRLSPSFDVRNAYYPVDAETHVRRPVQARDGCVSFYLWDPAVLAVLVDMSKSTMTIAGSVAFLPRNRGDAKPPLSAYTDFDGPVRGLEAAAGSGLKYLEGLDKEAILEHLRHLDANMENVKEPPAFVERFNYTSQHKLDWWW